MGAKAKAEGGPKERLQPWQALSVYKEFWDHSDRVVGTLARTTGPLHTTLAAEWRETERQIWVPEEPC